MLKITTSFASAFRSQRGVAAVEFALIAMLLFVVLFGILELGRLFYVFNSAQEVTRRAAREAVVRWHTQEDEVKSLALFGATNLPAAAMINEDTIVIEYLNPALGASDPLPASSAGNIAECLAVSNSCIAFVRVSIVGATYDPLVGLFSGINITAFPFSEQNPFNINLSIPIPASTVTMPAESMGYSG